MIKPDREQYLWIRRNATENDVMIVDDPIALFVAHNLMKT